MQSGYGVPETQQFMLDGCGSSSLLSISQAPPKQSGQYHHLQFQSQTQAAQPFFHQCQYPQFQSLLHQRQLTQESAPDHESHPSRVTIGSSGSSPSFVVTNLKFGAEDGSDLNGYNQALQGGREVGCVEEQAADEVPVIKEPFWKPQEMEYMNRNNKRCKERMETSYDFCKKVGREVEMEEGKSSSSDFGLFGELEAIYTASGGVGNGGNRQAGSSSVLTGDQTPASAAVLGFGSAGHTSETSTGEEASLKLQKSRRRKKRQRQLEAIATFFDGLVKQLMAQQDSMHNRFLEALEKKDQERTAREEAWRKQEAEKSSRDAEARAEEHAQASNREAAIAAFLEKIAGKAINLPAMKRCQNQFKIPTVQTSEATEKVIESAAGHTNDDNSSLNPLIGISRRWPKAEVQALIQVRSGLEPKFQEPALKGPLWELVSSSMASKGYQRSAKRCKEKWENINKYFRKTRDSVKKRPHHSKTCPYFQQLDLLYSKSQNRTPHNPNAISEQKDHSELLEAIVVPPERGNSRNLSLDFSHDPVKMRRGFDFSEMGSLGLDFNGNIGPNRENTRERFGSDEEFENEVEEEDDDDDRHDFGEDVDGEELMNHVDRQHSHEHALLFGLES